MTNSIFICIGTKNLIADSFGPRVGEKLLVDLKQYPWIEIYGTMKKPVHFKNARNFLQMLENKEPKHVILIDSAFGKQENIGNTYVNFGGMEIGKALGKSFYFPAHLNMKTVIGNQNHIPKWTEQQIDWLAQKVANKITKIVKELS